jgi:hypothetical protein
MAGGMSTAPAALILDFLDHLAAGARSYTEVMEAWRTSCPRLTVWEDAVDEGLVVRRVLEGEGVVVELTAKGREVVRSRGAAEAHVEALVQQP